MAKTLSFAAVHMAVAFGVGYAFTGDVRVGGALALVEPFCNTIAYHFHEKVWKRIERSRDGERNSSHLRRGRYKSVIVPS
ncbi:MAG: DUF2061 domain-containing protein [Lysobacteraceae bacterium]